MTDLATTETPQSSGQTIAVTYDPRPGLGWLSIKNFLLTIITLGFYRFWAKTNVRKHVWSCVKINGEPLEYTGTGTELFLGALIVFFIIFLPFIVIVNGLQVAGYPIAAALAQLSFTLLFLLLIGMAIYRARRYRLSRTVWRGVRGTLAGSSLKYSLLYFGSLLLASITLGWSNPAMSLTLQERITKEMRFGETPFHFKGETGPLYVRYAICWFVSLVAIIILISIGVYAASIGGIFDNMGDFMDGFKRGLQESTNSASEDMAILFAVLAIYGGIFVVAIVMGIIWTFYTSLELALFAKYTTFDNAGFKLNTSTGSLIALWVGNLLIMIFTLGIAAPYTVQRLVRYFADRLEVSGWVDIGKIEQSRAKVDSTGEGLLDAFDLDGI